MAAVKPAHQDGQAKPDAVLGRQGGRRAEAPSCSANDTNASRPCLSAPMKMACLAWLFWPGLARSRAWTHGWWQVGDRCGLERAEQLSTSPASRVYPAGCAGQGSG